MLYGGIIPSLHDMLQMYGLNTPAQVITLIIGGVLLVGMLAMAAGIVVGSRDGEKTPRNQAGRPGHAA